MDSGWSSGQGALAVGGRHDRGAEVFGQGAHLLSGGTRPAPDDQQGSLRPGTALGRLLHRGAGRDPDGRGQRADQVDVRLAVEQVERHLQVHRPRASLTHGDEGLRDGQGDLRDAGDPVAVGQDRVQRAPLVLELVQQPVAAPRVAERHPRRDEQHRHRVRVGLRGGRGGVEHRRSGRGETHPRAPGHPGVAVCGVARALLVPGRDVPDAVPGQLGVDRQVVGAGDPEDGVDTVGDERRHKGPATGHPCHQVLRSLVPARALTCSMVRTGRS